MKVLTPKVCATGKEKLPQRPQKPPMLRNLTDPVAPTDAKHAHADDGIQDSMELLEQVAQQHREQEMQD